MTFVSGGKLARFLLYVLTVATFAPHSEAKPRPPHPYRYSILDLPISLASRTITTPAFTSAKTSRHWILIQIEKPLSIQFSDLRCMMGVTDVPLLKQCTKPSLVHAHWTVFSDGVRVAEGESENSGSDAYTREYIFKFIGGFPAKAGMRYTIEVSLADDGTALDIANPHLIVVKQGDE